MPGHHHHAVLPLIARTLRPTPGVHVSVMFIMLALLKAGHVVVFKVITTMS